MTNDGNLFSRFKVCLAAVLLGLPGVPGWVAFGYGQSLMTAIQRNDPAEIRQLVEKNSEVLNAIDANSRFSPLHTAIQSRKAAAVNALLDLGADVNSRNGNGMTPLMMAMQMRQSGIIDAILEKKPDLNVSDRYGRSVFNFAIMYTQGLGTFEKLIDSGVNIDHTNKDNVSLLQLACNYRRPDVAQLLLDRGAKFDTVDKWKNSPFLVACQSGMHPAVETLIKKGADPQARNSQGQTGLYLASQSGNLETVKILAEHVSDMNIADNQGNVPIIAAVFSGNAEIAKFLLGRGANPNAKPEYQNAWTALCYSCSTGRPDLVNILLEAGADPDLACQEEDTPLHFSVRAGNMSIQQSMDANSDRQFAKPYIELIQALLAKNADPNLKNKAGRTPLEEAVKNEFYEGVEELVGVTRNISIATDQGNILHWAASKGMPKTIAEVLKKQGNRQIDTRNTDDQTPLMVAAAEGKTKVVTLLLKNRADVTLKDDSGLTPLMLACGEGHQDVVQLLLDSGSSTNVTAPSGQSPLHLAAWNGNKAVVDTLLKSGSNPRSRTQTGYTPLHAAAWQGSAEIIHSLIDAGAAIDAADSDGWTPLHKAAFRGHANAVRALIANAADAKLKNLAGLTALDISKDDAVKTILKKALN